MIQLGADSLSPSPDTALVDVCGKGRPGIGSYAEIEAVFQYHCGPGKGEPLKLFISGPVTPDKAIMNHLAQKLKVKMVTVDLLNPANPFLSQVRPPPSLAERARPRRWDWLFCPNPAPQPSLPLCPKKLSKPRFASIGRCFGLWLCFCWFWEDLSSVGSPVKSDELARLREENLPRISRHQGQITGTGIQSQSPATPAQGQGREVSQPGH